LSSYAEENAKTSSSKSLFRWVAIALLIAAAIAASSAWAIWGAGSKGERYEFKGKVILIEREKKRVTIDHEEIKGYMDAMTMPFPVRDEQELDGIESDDTIKGILVIDGDRYWIEKLVIVQKGK
jgi:protein SCO1/2